MKVAHVTLYPPKGKKHISSSGVASYSKNLVTHIPVEHQQTVVCDITENSDMYIEDEATIRRTFKRRPGFIRDIHSVLKKIDPDVVHIQQELSLFGGIATAYILQWLVFLWQKKTVITLHGVVDPSSVDAAFVRENNSHLPVFLVRLAFRIIYTPLMKWSQKIIVHEQLFKDIIMRSYGISGDKIAVIPHGVERLHTIEKTKAREILNLPISADVILFMGYATGYKGLDLLIEGFAQYADQNTDAFLVIGAGKHPKLHDNDEYLAEYNRLVEKAALLLPKRQYVWKGFISESDITAYYSASDVSVYPYTTALSSSGPMSLAIGYEKPFLVSDAFSSVFKQQPHLLFERNAGAVAEKLDHFFSHRSRYEKTSSGMKNERDWKNVGRSTAAVYESVG